MDKFDVLYIDRQGSIQLKVAAPSIKQLIEKLEKDYKLEVRTWQFKNGVFVCSDASANLKDN
jgi:hypothetical protein